MIEQIGLSLSNRCGATCVFCPSSKNRIGDMSMEIVQKVMNEVNSEEFKSKHNLKGMRVSENGDGLLNKNFIDILRLIKTTNPNLMVGCNTTFHNMTEDIGKIIIEEELIDEIVTYVDGLSSDYTRLKHIPFSKVENNLLNFLDNKDRKVKVNILHLGLNIYISAIHKKFGFFPTNIKPDELFTLDEILNDKFEEVVKKWKPHLRGSDRIIRAIPVLSWAEREKIKLLGHDQSKFVCPRIPILQKEFLIAPNGDVYACCQDDEQKLIYGNVMEDSIDNIYSSKKRKEFLNNLKNHEYDKIGHPCNIIESCQNIEEFPYKETVLSVAEKTYAWLKFVKLDKFGNILKNYRK